MPESPKKANLDVEENNPINEEENSNEDVLDIQKDSKEEEKKKEDNIEKPTKKIHNFFGI